MYWLQNSYGALSSDLMNVQLQFFSKLSLPFRNSWQITLQAPFLNNPLLHNLSEMLRMLKPMLSLHQSNITLFHINHLQKCLGCVKEPIFSKERSKSCYVQATKMKDTDSMDTFLTNIKDFKNNYSNIDEVISLRKAVNSNRGTVIWKNRHIQGVRTNQLHFLEKDNTPSWWLVISLILEQNGSALPYVEVCYSTMKCWGMFQCRSILVIGEILNTAYCNYARCKA